MINISLDNPLLLLLLIPLLAAVIVPFAIAIRKENKGKDTTTALVCHILIVVLCVLAVAGLKNISVMTKTEVYVLADVSYSTNENLDLIDSYIKELKGKLPYNSKMGVIAFGKDAELNTPLGKGFSTVKNSGVDAGATDILGAVKYADSLFSEDTIKHIVLYTDGLSTDPEASGELVRVIEDMSDRGVYFDVVYINSNISEDAREIQISDIEFNASTYLGHKTTANVLIESTFDTDVIVKLEKNGEAYLERAVKLGVGYNIVNFDLYTDDAGENEYEVSMVFTEDTSSYNNKYSFTQIVNEKIAVLVVSDSQSDVDMISELYGENAVIDAYVKPKKRPSSYWGPEDTFDVPFTVEDLCKYDEYVLSNVDIKEINNAETFVKSIDICVSMFGKSLITAGNNNLRIEGVPAVDALNNMLPVKFGNSDQDPKLYAIVIDSSRSMEFKNFDYFKMAKLAGKYLLDFLNDTDYFTVVSFSGEVNVICPVMQANKDNIAQAKADIDALEVTQGTMIGRTLEQVHALLAPHSFDEKQVMLISDGMSFEGGEVLTDDPIGAAMALKNDNIIVSALNAGNTEGEGTMKSIAAAGGGKYYFSKSSDDLVGVMFEQIADDVTDTLIEGTTPVTINRPNDSVLEGIFSLPDVEGYVYAKAKASAENVLLVSYKKASGAVVKVPLYAYWEYGSGRVTTLTTNLGGDWVKSWQDGDGQQFLTNITTTNIPETKIDHPYTVEVRFDGKHTYIEILPAVINPDATMTVNIVLPDGSEQTELLTFDSYRYFYKFETGQIGRYTINTTYDWITKSYTSTNIFNISYSPEYDSFSAFSPAALHTVVRDNGTVTEKGNTEFNFDETRLEAYEFSFMLPLLAIAAVLYVADTIIRKLKWADIKSFFKRRKKGAPK